MISREVLVELEVKRAAALAAHDRWLDLHKDPAVPTECVARAAAAATSADAAFTRRLLAEVEPLMRAAWSAIDPPPTVRLVGLLAAVLMGALVWAALLMTWGAV